MKKLIIILTVVIISLNLSAQSKDSANGFHHDMADAKFALNDSVPILSVRDINNYLQQLSQSNVFTPKEFSQFMQVLQQIIATKQKELSNGKGGKK